MTAVFTVPGRTFEGAAGGTEAGIAGMPAGGRRCRRPRSRRDGSGLAGSRRGTGLARHVEAEVAGVLRGILGWVVVLAIAVVRHSAGALLRILLCVTGLVRHISGGLPGVRRLALLVRRLAGGFHRRRLVRRWGRRGPRIHRAVAGRRNLTRRAGALVLVVRHRRFPFTARRVEQAGPGRRSGMKVAFRWPSG
ncbi:hypothetical protein [Fodinicola feengrottensis]|uniref:hypothetical protein n=1 Tax=Fodinicola feengrottensis TaxID=435914 RepID=UPI0024419647|nr:hypothetical protein [Fodinicola feengrottensis]